jgi:hypothetical protein
LLRFFVFAYSSGNSLNIQWLHYDFFMPLARQIALRLGWVHLNVLKQLQKREQDTRASIIRRAILEYAERRGVRAEPRSK